MINVSIFSSSDVKRVAEQVCGRRIKARPLPDSTPLTEVQMSGRLAAIIKNLDGIFERAGQLKRRTDADLLKYRGLGIHTLTEIRTFAPYTEEPEKPA
jgi:hypothetical protein